MHGGFRENSLSVYLRISVSAHGGLCWPDCISLHPKYILWRMTLHPPGSYPDTINHNRQEQTMTEQQPTIYELHVGGRLSPRWAQWFEEMTLTPYPDSNTTRITGAVADQAALHGILNKIRDLGIPLLAVTRLEETPS